jgi:hypothetical protein
MDQMPTSNADEPENPDTAPSKKSAKTTPPETATDAEDQEKLYLIEEMAKLPDKDLIRLGLAAMALLHQRILDMEGEAQADDS